MTKICDVCGREFEGTRQQVHCPECARKLKLEQMRRHRLGLPPDKVRCPMCGRLFSPTTARQHLCSYACFIDNKEKRRIEAAGGIYINPYYDPEEAEWRAAYERCPEDPRHLDKTLARCKQEGISYAEMQMRDTLRMLAERKGR